MIEPRMNDCRFCSVISKSNGEDPIGSAQTLDRWLIIEMAQPWPRRLWEEIPTLHQIYDLVEVLYEQQINIRSLVVAPDREYSRPNATRVLYYRRPARLLAQFEKQEFILPEDQVVPLATALLQQPDQLPRFQQYQQETSHIRELMVCTHANVDVACARFGYPIYEKLRQKYAANSTDKLRVWRVSHIGGHEFAPTLIDLPQGHYWGHLEPEVLELLVRRDGSVSKLRSFYRGWAGLTRLGQVAEREIWMQVGWAWLDYLKAEQVLAIDEANEEWDADWAEVRLDFAAPDGSVFGAYEARVEVCGHVMTAWDSGDDQPLRELKQYRVSRLVKVA